MGKDDLAKFSGVVIDVHGGGNFSVRLANGHVVRSRLSGRMRRYSIRVILGDKVTVGVSPYDLSCGLILEREKLAPRGFTSS